MIIILGEKKGETGTLQEARLLYENSPSPILLYGNTKEMKKSLLQEGVKEEHIIEGGELEDTVSVAYKAKTEHFVPNNKKKGTVIIPDFRLERVEYIFWKVFGNDYDLYFHGVASPGACGTKKIIKERQSELNEKAKALLGRVEEGNHRAIKEILDDARRNGNIN